MTTEARARYDALGEMSRRARTEVCTCGRDVTVAFVQGEHKFRCGKCGYDPPMTLRDTRSLRTLYKQGHSLSALEKQTLWRQLYNSISQAAAAGRRNTEAEALLERLEIDMNGKGPTQAIVLSQERRIAANYTAEDLDIIRKQVAPGLDDEQFSLFMATARHRKLDPFAKQIYGVIRMTWNPKTKTRERRMVIITGIDGYRAIAGRNRHKPLAGSDRALYGPDIPDDKTARGFHPEWAEVTVYQMVQGTRCPYTLRVFWDGRKQFTQDDKGNIKYTGRWIDDDRGQLAKCSEAAALRQGWPEDLGDIEYGEEGSDFDPVDGWIDAEVEPERSQIAGPGEQMEAMSNGPDGLPGEGRPNPQYDSFRSGIDGTATLSELKGVREVIDGSTLSDDLKAALRTRAAERGEKLAIEAAR